VMARWSRYGQASFNSLEATISPIPTVTLLCL
jgi:hypothetical protein